MIRTDPAQFANVVPYTQLAKDLTTILRQGVGKMPAVGSDWTDDQITALVKYTTQLVKGQSSGG